MVWRYGFLALLAYCKQPVAFLIAEKTDSPTWQSGLGDLVDGVVITPLPLSDGDGKDVRQRSKIEVDCCVAPCSVAWRSAASEHVTVLGNEGWGNIGHATVAQVGFPPSKLLRLLPDGRRTFVGQGIGNVAVNQVCQRVALGFSGLEVSSLDNGRFGDLHPLASVREFGKGC